MFFSSQNIDFPFLFEETLRAFLFSSSFFNILSLSFSMLHLFEYLGILMINELKNTVQKNVAQPTNHRPFGFEAQTKKSSQ
jgi:hypothetical protein